MLSFPLRTLSSRIIFGFAVLIITFSAISLLTLRNMGTISQEIRIIRVVYIELALIAKDLSEKQKNLSHYLNNELTGQGTARQVERKVRSFRNSRKRQLTMAKDVLDGPGELRRTHTRALERTAARIDKIRSGIAVLEQPYADLLLEPPLDRTVDDAVDDATIGRREKASAALELLRQAERRLYGDATAFERQQRDLVKKTALRLEQLEYRLRLYTSYLGITALIVGLLMTLWVTFALRPLRRLRDAARRIAGGDYASRIDESGPGEVAELAAEFNVMGHAIEERQRELVRSERLVAVGKIAAMITHEVRNPLSAIGLNTELLEEELAQLPFEQVAEARSLCQAITHEVDRLTDITEEYLRFARMPKPKLRLDDLARIVRSLAEFESAQLESRGVTLAVTIGDDLPQVLCDDGQLRQALLNLLRNAAEAVEGNERGAVELAVTHVRQDNVLKVRVRDNGPGISEDVALRLFEPFFSTKEGGTGLGLALTHQIVSEHNGTLRVENPGQLGASMVVTLPVVTDAAASPPSILD